MKQKIVIKVHMSCDQCRSKAMVVAAAVGGVDSVAIAGADRDEVVVVGNVDSVKLTRKLRKKVGPSRLVQVGEAKKEDGKPAATAPEYPSHWHYPPLGIHFYDLPAYSACSIL